MEKLFAAEDNPTLVIRKILNTNEKEEMGGMSQGLHTDFLAYGEVLSLLRTFLQPMSDIRLSQEKTSSFGRMSSWGIDLFQRSSLLFQMRLKQIG